MKHANLQIGAQLRSLVAIVVCCAASVTQDCCQTIPGKVPKSSQPEASLAETNPSKPSAESTCDYLNGLSREIFSCSDQDTQLKLTGEYRGGFARLIAESGLDRQTTPPYHATGFMVTFFDGRGVPMEWGEGHVLDEDSIRLIVAIPTGFGKRLMPVVTRPMGTFVVELWTH